MVRAKGKPRRFVSTGIPKATFTRIVRKIAHDVRGKDVLWQPDALKALQEGAEALIDTRFSCAQRFANMCKVDTVTLTHFKEATTLLG